MGTTALRHFGVKTGSVLVEKGMGLKGSVFSKTGETEAHVNATGKG